MFLYSEVVLFCPFSHTSVILYFSFFSSLFIHLCLISFCLLLYLSIISTDCSPLCFFQLLLCPSFCSVWVGDFPLCHFSYIVSLPLAFISNNPFFSGIFPLHNFSHTLHFFLSRTARPPLIGKNDLVLVLLIHLKR